MQVWKGARCDKHGLRLLLIAHVQGRQLQLELCFSRIRSGTGVSGKARAMRVHSCDPGVCPARRPGVALSSAWQVEAGSHGFWRGLESWVYNPNPAGHLGVAPLPAW